MKSHQPISIELIHQAFEKITQSLTTLSADELAKLCSDDYALILNIKKITRSTKRASTQNHSATHQASELTPMLMNCATREEAMQLLTTHCKLKRDLENLARDLEVAISKKDRIADLRDKIVDATVGAKLRSAAIQNTQ